MIIRPGRFFTPASAEDAAWPVESRACRPAPKGEEKLARDPAANDAEADEPLDAVMMARPGLRIPNNVDPIEDEDEDDGRDLL